MRVSTVGVVQESAEGEHRVALSPDGVQRLRHGGYEVLVQAGAGDSAWFPDAEYAAAGARSGEQAGAARPCGRRGVRAAAGGGRSGGAARRAGAVGLLQPLTDPELAAGLAGAGVTAISLDGLPRTVSRAQSMDALSSQANVAGYKAALLAADTYSNYLPMFMTAAGTTRPALVLVIGAGVAGLQAIGTARRLGAVVTGYDVRDAARGDVLSTGATFLDLGVQVSAVGEGGYARELTEQERRAQQDALNARDRQVRHRHHHRPGAGSATTAAGVRDRARRDAGRVGGRRPRIQRAGWQRRGLRSRARRVVTANGVTVVGAANLPSAVPKASSTAYSRNMCALLAHLIPDGELAVDPADEITAGVLVTHRGEVVHPAVRALLTGGPGGTGGAGRTGPSRSRPGRDRVADPPPSADPPPAPGPRSRLLPAADPRRPRPNGSDRTGLVDGQLTAAGRAAAAPNGTLGGNRTAAGNGLETGLPGTG